MTNKNDLFTLEHCEGRHMQQVCYSTFHDALTQICYGCKKIRTSIYHNKKEDLELIKKQEIKE
jgi:hypothetical protein